MIARGPGAWVALAGTLIGLVGIPPVAADPGQPSASEVEVSSDWYTIQVPRRVFLHRGNVRVRLGAITLRSRDLEIDRSRGGDLERIEAVGAVRLTSREGAYDTFVLGGRARFDPVEGWSVSERARVWSPSGFAAGASVNVNRGGRVFVRDGVDGPADAEFVETLAEEIAGGAPVRAVRGHSVALGHERCPVEDGELAIEPSYAWGRAPTAIRIRGHALAPPLRVRVGFRDLGPAATDPTGGVRLEIPAGLGPGLHHLALLAADGCARVDLARLPVIPAHPDDDRSAIPR